MARKAIKGLHTFKNKVQMIFLCSSLFVLVRPCSALFDVEQRLDQPNMDEVECRNNSS